MDVRLYHPYRSLVLAVVGALLFVALTVSRQTLGWVLLLRGERVDSIVLSIDASGYRVKMQNGETLHVEKAGTVDERLRERLEFLTGRKTDVGDRLSFYWIPGSRETARLVRLPPASTLLFLMAVTFLGVVAVGTVVACRKVRRERVAARV